MSAIWPFAREKAFVGADKERSSEERIPELYLGTVTNPTRTGKEVSAPGTDQAADCVEHEYYVASGPLDLLREIVGV